MRFSSREPLSRIVCIALVGGGLAALAAPVLAQSVDELTITGRYGSMDNVRELSRVVTYSDLDLTTPAGVDGLKFRVKDTARGLCAELGESGSGGPLVPSCERQAINDAMAQVNMAIASATPRGDMIGPPMSMGAATAPMEDPAMPPATFTTRTITNGPVPDTAENRARYGQPMSRAGKMTAPRAN